MAMKFGAQLGQCSLNVADNFRSCVSVIGYDIGAFAAYVQLRLVCPFFPAVHVDTWNMGLTFFDFSPLSAHCSALCLCWKIQHWQRIHLMGLTNFRQNCSSVFLVKNDRIETSGHGDPDHLFSQRQCWKTVPDRQRVAMGSIWKPYTGSATD